MKTCEHCGAPRRKDRDPCSFCGMGGTAMIVVPDQQLSVLPSQTQRSLQTKPLQPYLDYPSCSDTDLLIVTSIVVAGLLFSAASGALGHSVLALVPLPLIVTLLAVVLMNMHEFYDYRRRLATELDEARRKRLFPDESSLHEFARNRAAEVLAGVDDYEQRSEALLGHCDVRWWCFLLANWDSGGEAVLSYYAEGRRLLQLARHFHGQHTPEHDRLRAAQTDAGVIYEQARLAALAEAEIDREQMEAAGELGDDYYPED